MISLIANEYSLKWKKLTDLIFVYSLLGRYRADAQAFQRKHLHNRQAFERIADEVHSLFHKVISIFVCKSSLNLLPLCNLLSWAVKLQRLRITRQW